MIIGESFSPCCVEQVACQHLSCHIIVHFGHACLSPTTFTVFYAFEISPLDLNEAKKAILETAAKAEGKKLVVFYDTDYAWAYNELCSLENEQIEISELLRESTQQTLPETENRRLFSGRLSSLPKSGSEDFVVFFIGKDGPFLTTLLFNHALSEVRHYDAETKQVQLASAGKLISRRYRTISLFKKANSVGIVVATLSVSGKNRVVEKLKSLIEESGKSCYLITMVTLADFKLANFPEIDVYIFLMIVICSFITFVSFCIKNENSVRVTHE